MQTPIDMTILQGTSERPESYAIFINTDGNMEKGASCSKSREISWLD